MENNTIGRGIREQQNNEQYQNFGQALSSFSDLESLGNDQYSIGQCRIILNTSGIYYLSDSDTDWEQCSAINFEPVFYMVNDIDMPIELYNILPRAVPEDEQLTDMIVAVQTIEGSSDKVTIYRYHDYDNFDFDEEDLGPLESQTNKSPYVMEINGQAGYWVAVGGNYSYISKTYNGQVTAIGSSDTPGLAIVSSGGESPAPIQYDTEELDASGGTTFYLPIRNLGQTQWINLLTEDNSAFISSNEVDEITTYDFGNVNTGEDSDLDVYVVNDTDGTCKLLLAVITDDNFSIVTNIPMIIAANSSEELKIRFSPSGSGSITGTINFFFDSESDPKRTIDLEGVGI